MSESDETSAETMLNAPSAGRGPDPDSYVPMSDAYAEPERPEKTYRGDEDGLRKAAKEVTEQRQEREPKIERIYINSQTGEPMPMNQTLSAERAATDLTRQRGIEAANLSPKAEDVANAIDAARQNYHQAMQGIEPQ